MPLEIVWSPLAAARLQEIRSYLAIDSPDAAERVAARIVALVENLRRFPRLGRVGAEGDVRELVIGGTPYVLLYRIQKKRVVIATIWHGAQSSK